MMFLGNYVFIRHLGEDGVAAFSIACYFFPIIFMVYNAIAQSAQPIISYNFGAGQPERVRKTLHLAIRTALICGISFFILTVLCCQDIVLLFIDRSYAAFDIAVNGLPYFGVGFIFLCRQHDWHWLLSECRKRSAGNNYHSSPGSRIYVDRILCAPSGIGYTGYLASRTIGRVINHFLYFRNLFERSFHCLPTISIFAI